MSLYGWLFDQVVIRMGGPDALLNAVMNQDAIQEILNGTTINDLPLALLAKVLSHVGRRSIFAMMQVCKVWLKAIHEQHHFWKGHIENALEQVICVKKITNKQHQAAIRMFNTFYSPVPETLRQQVEWVFRIRKVSTWINLVVSLNNTSYIIERASHDSGNLSNWILLNTLKVKQVSWYKGSNFDEDEGRFCRHIIIPTEFNSTKYCSHVDVPKYEQPGIGTFIDLDSKSTFVGQIVFGKTFGYRAHGDGKWTFDDGTVLEGKGVAHNGEPRFIMEAEDVREWKRRRITN